MACGSCWIRTKRVLDSAPARSSSVSTSCTRANPLDDADFRNDAGTPGEFEFEDNPNNMDAGYKADVFHIIVDFPSSPPDRLLPSGSSTWTVLGTTLADFDTFATANNKPSPIFSVISVTAYSLSDPKPTASNWVAVIPEPGTGVLMLIGIGAMRVLRRPGRVREM